MRKSVIPVILIAVVAALCLSFAFAGSCDQTGEKEASLQFGDATAFNVTGTVKDGSSPIAGATVTILSEYMGASCLTDSSGNFSLTAIPGTYDLTVNKIGYVTYTAEVTVKTSDVAVPSITMSAKTAVNGSTLTGYVMALDDFARYAGSAVDIRLYYRTTEASSSTFSDYVELQYTSTIDTENGTFKITNVKYDSAPGKDTLVDRCYIKLSIDTYSVANVSSSCITDKVVFTDGSGVKTTLYHLNEDISPTGSFEDNVSYSLGNEISAGIMFEPATGTVSGTMSTSGTVTITDSSNNVLGEGVADSSGNYSFTSYVGKNLTITYSSVGYKNKPLTITVYDDNVAPLKNKQSYVELEEIPAGKAYVKFYIDGKTSRIDDESIQKKFTIYLLMNPSETDPSKRVYEAKWTTSALITDMKDSKVKGYYFEFNIDDGVDCARCFLCVEIVGYSVRTVQSEFMEKTPTLVDNGEKSSNRLKAAISSTGVFNSGKSYSIGTGSSDAILVDSATGTVKGDVRTNTDNSSALNGVKVSLLSKTDNTVIAYGITYNKGNYSITAPTGEYKITYQIEGYTTYESTVKVYDDSIYDPSMNEQSTVKLDAEKGDWFGMDLPHALLVIAGIITVILICAVLYHRFRILKKKDTVIYEDDEEDSK